MIGVFDSGIGGLTVVKELRRLLPSYDLVYLGDTAHVPYGNKSPELIKKYAKLNTEFLLERGAKLIIIACNSASAVAREFLRQEFSVPILGVIGPAVIAAREATVNGNIGVIGTRATVNSGIYELVLKNLNQPQLEQQVSEDINTPAFMRKGMFEQKEDQITCKIHSQSTPLLVPLVEEGMIDTIETKRFIKKYLQPLKIKQVDTLILGCTHYPLLKDIIQSKLPKVRLIDPALTIALELKKYLKENNELDRMLSKRGKLDLNVSDLTPHIQDVATKWLNQKVNLAQISLNE